MSVTVVIPYAGTCPHRERAMRFLVARYAMEHMDWRVVIARGEVPWSKGAAVAPAIERTHSDVIVVADADVWSEGLVSAIRAVTCGAASWAVPHRKVHRLTQAASGAYMRDQEPGECEQAPYEGVAGGGIVVAPREVLLDCPIDPRFIGWGQEDEAWALALNTLHGEGWRGDTDLIHLWHPHPERLDRRHGSTEGWQLFHRYRKARRDPEAMRRLIGEFRDRDTFVDSMHHHEAGALR